MKERDFSLDFVKGIACILMILAHAAIKPTNGALQENIYHGLTFIGGLAPLGFFAVSGVTSSFQSKKNMREIMTLYVLIAIIGLSYNLIWTPNLYNNFSSDIFQMIAMGTVLTVLLEKYVKPNKWVYLIFATLVFLIHYFITRNISSFVGKQLLFAPGTFTLFPWVSMFFLGIFFYKLKPKISLMFSIIFSCVLIAIIYFYKLDITKRFDMNIGYFIMSIIVISFVFYISKKIKRTQITKPIMYFGESSLLFLYVHLLIINISERFINNYFIVYLIVIIMVYPLMEISKILNRYIEKYFYNYVIWALMILGICIIPILTTKIIIIKMIGIAFGLLFANNYKKLSSIVFNFNKTYKSETVKDFNTVSDIEK